MISMLIMKILREKIRKISRIFTLLPMGNSKKALRLTGICMLKIITEAVGLTISKTAKKGKKFLTIS